jgi:hypothetical protein
MDNPKRARSWKRRTQSSVGLRAAAPFVYSKIRTHGLNGGLAVARLGGAR